MTFHHLRRLFLAETVSQASLACDDPDTSKDGYQECCRFPINLGLSCVFPHGQVQVTDFGRKTRVQHPSHDIVLGLHAVTVIYHC